MPAIDTIVGFITDPGIVPVPVTNTGAGDSLRVRAFPASSRAWLLNAWVHLNAPGQIVISSPQFHSINSLTFNSDMTTGGGVQEAENRLLMPMCLTQELKSQDMLSMLLSGSVAGGNIESGILMLYYESLAGCEAHLIDEMTLRMNQKEPIVVSSPLGSGGTPDYAGATALTAFLNGGAFKKNSDYALLGYTLTTAANQTGAVTIRGTDTGNLRIPMPGTLSPNILSTSYFLFLSRSYGLPLIPVISQRNMGGTFVEISDNQLGVALNVTLFFMRVS